MIAPAWARQFWYLDLMNLSIQSPIILPAQHYGLSEQSDPAPGPSIVIPDSLEVGYMTSTERSCLAEIQKILLQSRQVSSRLALEVQEVFYLGISAPAL